MIEAYEIGIRLALDDGVSAGVEEMTRELAALSRLVDESAPKLASLREAAAAAWAPEADRASAPKETAMDEEEGVAESATYVPPVAQSERDAPPAAAPHAAPRLQPFTATPEAAETGPDAGSGENPAVVAAAPAGAAVPVPPPAMAPGPATPAAPAPVVEAGAPEPAGKPTPHEPTPFKPARAFSVRLLSAGATTPKPPESVAAATAIAFPLGRTPAKPSPPSEPSWSSGDRPAAFAPVEVGFGEPARAEQPERRLPPARPQAPIGPVAAPQAPRAAAAPATPAAPARIEREAAPRPEPGQQAMNVHVYLDGAPLGRWMEGHLERAASRPQASTTAFDPRVGPSWPGAPIG